MARTGWGGYVVGGSSQYEMGLPGRCVKEVIGQHSLEGLGQMAKRMCLQEN